MTMDHEAMDQPAVTPWQQERLRERFQRRFNTERPREALYDRAPEEVYTHSPRSMPRREPVVGYRRFVLVRRVRHDGSVKWAGESFLLSETLFCERIGFAQSKVITWSLRLEPARVDSGLEAARKGQ